MDNEEFDWNECYSGEISDCEAPNPLLLEIASARTSGRALDVGCGAGGLAVALAERGFEVTGVDIASRAIEAARKLAAARGVKVDFHAADATGWAPTGHFDLIVSSFALPGTVAGRARVFSMLEEALAPGGIVVLEDFDATMKSKNPHFASFDCPTVEEVVEAFAGLEVIRAEVVDTPPHDHDGAGKNAGEKWSAVLFHGQKPR